MRRLQSKLLPLCLLAGIAACVQSQHTASQFRYVPDEKVEILDASNKPVSSEAIASARSLIFDGHRYEITNSLATASELKFLGWEDNDLNELQIPIDRTTSKIRFWRAVKLTDGRILLVGGTPEGRQGLGLNNTWTVDQVRRTLIPGPPMRTARMNCALTLLSNDQVLITGGTASLFGRPLRMVELYDAKKNTIKTVGNLSVGRANHSAAKLSKNEVVVAGGESNDLKLTSTVELFNLQTGRCSVIANLIEPVASP